MASNEMEIDQPGSPDGDAKNDAPTQTRTHDDAAAVRSIEGWIVLATNVHEEASEDDLTDFFNDFGTVKNLHMNLDRRSGYVKGYVLVEYATVAEAREAIDKANGAKLLDQTLAVDFAFVRPPPGEKKGRGGKSARGGRARSRSPGEDGAKNDAE